jgi:hypothetical protein
MRRREPWQGVPVFCSPIRCLRSAAVTVARMVPRRRPTRHLEPHSHARARVDPVSVLLRGVPIGTYLLEERPGPHGRQRILWRLSEGTAGDETP